jgi:hypothetical protein
LFWEFFSNFHGTLFKLIVFLPNPCFRFHFLCSRYINSCILFNFYFIYFLIFNFNFHSNLFALPL